VIFRPAALAAAAAVGCATPLVSAFASTQTSSLPPYAGTYEPQGVDERGLWMQMDEQERGLLHAPFVLDDRALNDYVRTVLCKTVGADRCAAVRTYVIKDESFNASMAPNGAMMVNTGLLARIHSEAELAMVLGHEFAHFELRHSVEAFRRIRNATDAMVWVSLLGAVVGVDMTPFATLFAARAMKFNRDQEQASDLLSARYAKASSYRLRASDMWRRLLAEPIGWSTTRCGQSGAYARVAVHSRG
jgi:beta-barrel assembly-enhancing protease